MSHLTSSVAHSSAITCYKSCLLCYRDSNICCHLYCCVTWLACYSPAYTWLRILLYWCRMCHLAAVNTVAYCSAHLQFSVFESWHWESCHCEMACFCALHCNTFPSCLLCYMLFLSKSFIECKAALFSTPSLFALYIHNLCPCPASSSVWTRSKSLSDIPMVYPVRKVPNGNTIYDLDQDTGMAREWNQENKAKCSVEAKDSEAQWHDVSISTTKICW